MFRPTCSCLAIAGVLFVPFVASAQTFVPWPAAGAPVCTAPGDQFGLMAPSFGGISWFTRAVAVDTLSLGGFSSEPPVGDCRSESAPVTAGVVAGSIATAVFETGIALGCPG